MRRLLLWPAAVLMLLSACSTVPAETERARGVLTGVPLVLALSVLFVVVALGMIGAVLAIDRAIRTRRALDEGLAVDEEEEPQDEVVAGITVGRAAVPRWLYGAYVLIPVFAFAYIASNIAPPPSEEGPAETAAPAGPCTECEITAAQILFDKDVLEVVAESDVTVTLHNEDAGVPHNLFVWEDEAAAQAGGTPIAQTAATVPGGSSDDAQFTSAAAGETWYFNCTIHPASMFGDIESVAG